MSTSTASAPPRQRQKQRSFSIRFLIDGLEYAVLPLRPDPAVASRAYRFVKRYGDRATYDVHVNGHGPECECKGWLRWRRPCKHIRTLAAAGMIPPLPTQEASGEQA